MTQSFDDARRRRDQPAGDTGRVPPHNLEAEESLLGAMLLSREAVASAVEVGLTADAFYQPSNGHVFGAATEIWVRGERADPVTVADVLRRDGLLDQVGGTDRLASLQANTPAIGNAGRYALIVAEHWTLRRLITEAGHLADLGYSVPEDVAAALDEAEARIYALRRHDDTSATVSYAIAAGEFLDALEARCAAGGVVEHPTGWVDYDELTAGLHPDELTILGGRTGMGKTSAANALVSNVARRGVPVLVVSIEMGARELVGRAIVAESRVDSQDVRRGRLTERDRERVDLAAGKVAELPVTICDASTATLMSVRATARRVASRPAGLGLIVIDYLQLMVGRKGVENRQVEVAELAQGLKVLARELHVPIWALAQLSRALDARADKRPTLADLRESGNIENSADVVVFCYRDEYYKADTPDRGIAELIVAKQRNGPLGTVRLSADMRHGTWANLARGALV